jgi:ribosomal protein S18 acetylase RimI-like enzyme
MIEITGVAKADLLVLQAISQQTFTEAFSVENSEENMRKYLNEQLSTEKLLEELVDKNSAFYFARSDNKVIGYLKLNFGQSQTEIKDTLSVEIERIYVLKEFYGKEVGKQLLEMAIQISRQRKADYIWLGVWEHNQKAISFYRKFGFTEFGTHIFKLGNEEQTDIMMKLAISDNSKQQPVLRE